MWTRVMIVLGADTHKRSHTLAAINVATGQVLGDKTVQVGPRGFAALLAGRAGSMAGGSGPWRTAGTFRGRWSASCSVAVNAS